MLLIVLRARIILLLFWLLSATHKLTYQSTYKSRAPAARLILTMGTTQKLAC